MLSFVAVRKMICCERYVMTCNAAVKNHSVHDTEIADWVAFLYYSALQEYTYHNDMHNLISQNFGQQNLTLSISDVHNNLF